MFKQYLEGLGSAKMRDGGEGDFGTEVLLAWFITSIKYFGV